MSNYISTHTGAQIDEAVTKGLQLPTVSAALAGKFLHVKNDGTLEYADLSGTLTIFEYGVSTYADVSAAINAGDTVLVSKNDGTGGINYYHYARRSGVSPNYSYMFVNAVPSSIKVVSIGSSGTWSEIDPVVYMQNPMTTPGDIIVGGTDGIAARLAKGTAGQVLKSTANGIEWVAESERIFVVTYGTTTYAEIANAVSAGKLPICKYTDAMNYEYMYIYQFTMSGSHVFYCFDGTIQRYITVGSNNDYLMGYNTLEATEHKVTSLSNLSTDTQYPSAKCMYDALASKQDSLVSGTNIKTVNGNSVLGSGDVDTNGNLAENYNSTSTYDEGDYCIYNHILYKCNTAITTAENWTAAHWTAVKVTDELGSGGGGSGVDNTKINVGNNIRSIYINNDIGINRLNAALAQLPYTQNLEVQGQEIPCVYNLLRGYVYKNNDEYYIRGLLTILSLDALGQAIGVSGCVGYLIMLTEHYLPIPIYMSDWNSATESLVNMFAQAGFDLGITGAGFYRKYIDIVGEFDTIALNTNYPAYVRITSKDSQDVSGNTATFALFDEMFFKFPSTFNGQFVTKEYVDSQNPMTAAGDMIYGGTNGTPTRLAIGTNNQILQLINGVPTWSDADNKRDCIILNTTNDWVTAVTGTQTLSFTLTSAEYSAFSTFIQNHKFAVLVLCRNNSVVAVCQNPTGFNAYLDGIRTYTWQNLWEHDLSTGNYTSEVFRYDSIIPTFATAGQVPVANGYGGLSWQSVPGGVVNGVAYEEVN